MVKSLTLTNIHHVSFVLIIATFAIAFIMVSFMTKDRLNKEHLYNLSVMPFKTLLKEKIISLEDYQKIDRLLQEKYHPLFVSSLSFLCLDNKKD